MFVMGLFICAAAADTNLLAQPYGQPDRSSPGDEMIQRYLQKETRKLSARFADDIASRAAWEAKRQQYVEEYLYMLGLSPRPEKTPLRATITGTFQGDGYVVDMIHYQSRRQLYVTGNLYRPAVVKEGEKLPAVYYVCGHFNRGRDGNKVAYQSHGIWFARHGYVCLVVDSLQLGEIAAFHHGTYNLQRWWWHSRGYTPAGVETWNGVRGIDYLISRPDVDPQRIAVTGISGGGAATYWVTAADERVKAAVPVSGMADLESYVSNRVINGHCDCMFLYNTFQWPWARIAGLIAPRPLLFVNSDKDDIFPMDANERVANGLERLYSLYGAGDRVAAVVSVGGHAYRQDIRQAAYRFINSHLKADAREVTDGEVDLVSEGGRPGSYPIPPQQLRVFPTDADLPKDQLNTSIDERFVPLGNVAAPEAGRFESWKAPLLAELRRVSFAYFPANIPAAKKLRDVYDTTEQFQSEEEIEFRVRLASAKIADGATNALLVVLNEDEAGTTPEWLSKIDNPNAAVFFCEPRGIGATKWTRKNPPNYVERSHALLGRTVDAGRVWDVIAAARYLSVRTKLPVQVAGSGAASVIAAYAAILDEQVAAATLVAPPTTHMDNIAPQFLNVLRTCDIPDALGLIAPRPLRIIRVDSALFAKTSSAYSAAASKERLAFK
ncbi:MAG: prolyl oligopeptidase family serine peptidase [Planctomycetota bacterium]|nr:prolyl oligopeptidase family serine peptidase [Planctomycetota bacterium]